MQFAGYQDLTFDRSERLLRLTINRPSALNAVNARLHRELSQVFLDIAKDEEVDVVVLSGEGAAFCAGGDIAWMQAMIEQPGSFAAIASEGRRIIHSLLALDKPVVCRLNGDAIGLGATLALFSDIIIANEDARIADPHVRVGLVAGDGGAVIWPQLIGFAKAKEFLMTGDALTGREAAWIGLINRAVPLAELDAEVDKVVSKLLRMPQAAMRWTKASINIALKQLVDTVLEASLAYEGVSATLPGHREAVSAFLEKRAPKLRG